MPLTPDQLTDFSNFTLSRFYRRRWVDISLPFQRYISASMFTKKKIQEQGGKDIEFQVQLKNTGNAVNTGLFAQDVTGVEDVSESGTVPWSKQSTNFSFDVDEPAFQTTETEIVSILAVREHDAYNSLHELNEENLWTAPTGTTDTRPMGIPFWIQKDATTDVNGAFNGGNPSGFGSGAAGISSTTNTNWRNWTFGYTQVTIDDAVKKMKKSIAFTRFVAPHKHPELTFGGSDYMIYTTYAVQEALERLAETRNDNLTNDVARYVDNILVAGIPTRWVPFLNENDTVGSIYGVCWQSFRPIVKRGVFMRPTRVPSPNQHTVRRVFYDTWMNYICINRRNQWRGTTS